MNHTYQTLCICAVREVLSDPKLEVRRVCYWHRMSGLLATFARFPCGFCLPKHHSQKPSFSCGSTLVHWHADWKVQRRWGFVHFCCNTLWCLFWFVEWLGICICYAHWDHSTEVFWAHLGIVWVRHHRLGYSFAVHQCLHLACTKIGTSSLAPCRKMRKTCRDMQSERFSS